MSFSVSFYLLFVCNMVKDTTGLVWPWLTFWGITLIWIFLFQIIIMLDQIYVIFLIFSRLMLVSVIFSIFWSIICVQYGKGINWLSLALTNLLRNYSNMNLLVPNYHHAWSNICDLFDLFSVNVGECHFQYLFIYYLCAIW